MEFGFDVPPLVLACDDAGLARQLLRAFDARRLLERPPGSVVDLGVAREGDGFTVSHAGAIARAGSASAAIGLVDAACEAHIRSTARGGVLTVHSCGLACGGKAVALVGVSGSGKTTLGLALADAGLSLLGDEFGFLDCETGLYWHAEYPIGLKAGTAEALGLGETPAGGVRSTSPYGVASTLVPAGRVRSALGRGEAASSSGLPLGAIVFPRFEGGSPTRVDGVSVNDLPQLLLPSIDGEGRRSEVFAKALSAASLAGAELLRITYGDAREAGQLLARRACERWGTCASEDPTGPERA